MDTASHNNRTFVSALACLCVFTHMFVCECFAQMLAAQLVCVLHCACWKEFVFLVCISCYLTGKLVCAYVCVPIWEEQWRGDRWSISGPSKCRLNIKYLFEIFMMI